MSLSLLSLHLDLTTVVLLEEFSEWDKEGNSMPGELRVSRCGKEGEHTHTHTHTPQLEDQKPVEGRTAQSIPLHTHTHTHTKCYLSLSLSYPHTPL